MKSVRVCNTRSGKYYHETLEKALGGPEAVPRTERDPLNFTNISSFIFLLNNSELVNLLRIPAEDGSREFLLSV